MPSSAYQDELPNDFRSSFGRRLQDHQLFTSSQKQTGSFNTLEKDAVPQTPSRTTRNDFAGRSPSPIQDMDYF